MHAAYCAKYSLKKLKKGQIFHLWGFKIWGFPQVCIHLNYTNPPTQFV
jgi:hypothetical protein